MIFDVLKSRWLRKEQDKIRKENRLRNASKPSSMVVLYNADAEKSTLFIEQWAKALGIEEVTLVGMTKDAQATSSANHIYLHSKSLKWSGGIADIHLENLLKSKVDLQINYFKEAEALIYYVALALRVDFKVGFPTQDVELYDLAIDTSLDQKELFIAELKKYLNIITT
ncbi:DUF6913 domain-containing protein [Nonlabens marinus]|uniref:Uncharacterized protein n=1 Tax=Nonlabens marinus S1-08 TaxID=1454201 RepID=W8VVZ2_9FLAO|nr:hypothetical protein [Nonlabens marinus]BAO55878.1 hypothetical protein NMS_1869 [Nonlabens marinus S1-08]